VVVLVGGGSARERKIQGKAPNREEIGSHFTTKVQAFVLVDAMEFGERWSEVGDDFVPLSHEVDCVVV
jgi:hypothetical protein